MHATILATTLFLPMLTSAVHVTGYIGGACMGERLWSFNVPSFQNCQSVDQYTQSDSIIVAEFNAGQVVDFYSSGDCSGNSLYQTTQEVCYTEPNDNVGSFRVAQAISRRGGGSLRGFEA